MSIDSKQSRTGAPRPRGLAADGPAILSYAFRPFFLLAGVFAVLSMSLWIGALSEGWAIGGAYGPLNWHAHEMLFGYTSAALAGFMLTAIPNWTGRLPVSGPPLAILALLWLAGRAAMLLAGSIGMVAAAIVDGSFLPALALIAGREIIAGRNWKNLKILLGLSILSAANVAFHVLMLLELDIGIVYRAAISAYVLLISVVGGRMVPSFSRNWLSRTGSPKLPAPFGGFDQLALGATAAGLLSWVVLPDMVLTMVLCLSAGGLQAARLWRWRGWSAAREPLVAILHLGYGFVPLGLAAIGASAAGWLSQASALHVLTVGAIGVMNLAVMTRATLGHTGRPLSASRRTRLAYAALLIAALCRPFAEILPDYFHPILALSGALWIGAFALFVVEYGPILLAPRSVAKG